MFYMYFFFEIAFCLQNGSIIFYLLKMFIETLASDINLKKSKILTSSLEIDDKLGKSPNSFSSCKWLKANS